MIFVGAIVVGSIYYKQDVFLNAAVVLAMVVFIGSIAFAKFMERRVGS
jgi:multisubunit Na+/H+ antiporter MnhF subunit